MSKDRTWSWPEYDRPFTQILDSAFREHGDRVCVQDDQHRWTYAELGALSARLANALLNDGFEVGWKAAVYSNNSAQSFLAAVAIIRAGGVWVPVNPRNPEDFNFNLLDGLGVRVIFHEDLFSDATRDFVGRCPGIRLAISLDGAGDSPDLFERIASVSDRPPVAEVSGSSLLSVPTTGGTTGEPKGVRLTHRNFVALSHAATERYGDRTPVVLCAAPMSHVGGRIALCALEAGARLVVIPRVDIGDVLATVEREKVTDFFLPPTAVYALLEHPNVRRADLSSISAITYGSAPISLSRLKEALEILPGQLRGGWGQTECPMFGSSLEPAEHYADGIVGGQLVPDHILRSVGRPTPWAEVVVVGEFGEPVGPRTHGEITVRGPIVSEGYYDDPDETSRATVRGAHRTGDIGFLDERGFLHLVDRKKDMIISGGFNVYSSQVEQAICEHPDISDAAVFGVADERWGEVVVAAVRVRTGLRVDVQDLRDFVRRRLGGVMSPKRIHVVTEFPTTAVGKIDKRELRRSLEAEES